MQLIKALNRPGLIETYYPSGTTGNILVWNSSFKTRNTQASVDNSSKNYFIIHFKKHFVSFNSYATLSAKGDVFPVKWILSVSNDNTTWRAIGENEEPACSDENAYKVTNEKKYNCNKIEEKQFSTNCTGYYSFVKFNMTENSYYNNNEWLDVIHINGFEMNGKYILERKTRGVNEQWNFVLLIIHVFTICS